MQEWRIINYKIQEEELMKCHKQSYRNYRIMEHTTESVEHSLKLGNSIEIHACEGLTKSCKVTMNPRRIEFFSPCDANVSTKFCDSVYVHLKTGGIQWIADFKNRVDARRFAKGLVKDLGYVIGEF